LVFNISLCRNGVKIVEKALKEWAENEKEEK
jgi:hypothetical protein